MLQDSLHNRRLLNRPPQRGHAEWKAYVGDVRSRRAGQSRRLLTGHGNVDTMLNVYTQVLDASLREAVERIGGG